jgi:hypothetical protein
MSDVAQPTAMSGTRRNPMLLVLLAVVGLAALALAGFMFLGGDDAIAAPEMSIDVTAASATEVTASGSEAEPVSFETLPTVTYDVFLSRDPFDPVVPEPVAATTEQAATQPSTEPVPYDQVQPIAGDDQNDDGSGGDDGTGDSAARDECRGGTEEVVCDGRVVSLLELTGGADPVAVVQVDTLTYEVRPGDRFAERFLFLDVVDAGTIRLLFGDEAFRLSVGERVMK